MVGDLKYDGIYRVMENFEYIWKRELIYIIVRVYVDIESSEDWFKVCICNISMIEK